MRMVAAHNVADYTGRFPVGFVGSISRLVHRIEDAPVNRLQAVAHVGNGAGDDHAHGVVEIGFTHLRLDSDGQNRLSAIPVRGRNWVLWWRFFWRRCLGIVGQLGDP